jgi:hypothetical protein
MPEHFLNVWIVDMSNTQVLGFSSFPWDTYTDGCHGVIINIRCFFPSEYGETFYSRFKTFTHEIGHYLGLLHTFSKGNIELSKYAAINMNDDTFTKGEATGDYIEDTPDQQAPTANPLDSNTNYDLLYNKTYNPLFMNFMDYTYDMYVTMFTFNQIQKMRYMIYNYRANVNSTKHTSEINLPSAKYDPTTIPAINSISRSVNNGYPQQNSQYSTQYSAQNATQHQSQHQSQQKASSHSPRQSPEAILDKIQPKLPGFSTAGNQIIQPTNQTLHTPYGNVRPQRQGAGPMVKVIRHGTQEQMIEDHLIPQLSTHRAPQPHMHQSNPQLESHAHTPYAQPEMQIPSTDHLYIPRPNPSIDPLTGQQTHTNLGTITPTSGRRPILYPRTRVFRK